MKKSTQRKSTNFRNVIGILILSSLSIWSCERPVDTVTVPVHTTSQLEIDHPFSVEATHLLDSDSRFDLLMQTRIDHYDIKQALDQIFVNEQLVGSQDTILRFQDWEIPVTRYDAQTRIGYLLLDHGRLGSELTDVIERNQLIEKEAKQKLQRKIADGIEEYFENEEMFLVDTISIWEAPQIPLQEINDLWTLHGSTDDGDSAFRTKYALMVEDHERKNGKFVLQPSAFERWASLDSQSDSQKQILATYQDEITRTVATLQTREDKREYLELVLLELCKLIQIDKLSAIQNPSIKDEWKLTAGVNTEDPEAFFTILARIDAVTVSSYQSELNGELRDIIVQLNTVDSRKEWLRKSRALVDLLSVNTNQIVSKSATYQRLLLDILRTMPYDKWPTQYAEIKSLSAAEEVSIDDLMQIHKLPNTHGIYIAPVSIFDDRMVYDMEEDAYLQELTTIRESIATSAPGAARKALQEELLDLTNHRATNYAEIRQEAKTAAIERLQKDMKEFIGWAQTRSEK